MDLKKRLNEEKSFKRVFIASIVFYAVAFVLMIVGTFLDLQIDKAVFYPESILVKGIEQFSQFVYWGMWGPIFTVLILSRHDLNESLEITGKVIPFIGPVDNTQTKAYKVCNTIFNIFTAVLFYVLSVIGWKKLVENVLKNILADLDIADMPQWFYFIVCAVLSAVVILACRKIDKAKLRKLEALALAGILLGICYKLVEECKDITGRVRFREMVAYSNGKVDESGMSNGQKADLEREMLKYTNYGQYAPWYKKGNDMMIYKHSNSFPSGHTAYCCTMFLTYPLCLAFEKLKKFAPFMFAFSAAYVILVAVSRLVAGAHYLTDVVVAAVIGYTLFLIVYKIYTIFTKKGIIG